ncbi:MAG: O-antigen ligase family protein [Acidobacteriia bacterium]|nr:O-antigen ligase family protein [Terriglobia bacterium]
MAVNETTQTMLPTGRVAEPDQPPVDGSAPPQGRPAQFRWSLGFVGMLAYLVVEYMRLSAQYQFLLPLQVGKVVIAICFLGWAVAPRVSGKRPAVRLVDVTMACLVFVTFLSASFARSQESAWTTFFDLFRWALIYFLIGRIVVSSWRQRVFVFLLLLLNLKMAQAAIRGFIAAKAFGRSAEFLAGMGVGAGSVGFFSNAGDFGVAMCVVWPLAGVLILGESKKIPRAVLLVFFLAFSGAIIVCGSRGAVVGAVIAALAAWARNPRRLGAAALFLLFVPGLIYVLPEASKARFRSALHWEEDRTASFRVELWRAGLRMFRDHPLLGVGPGNFPPSYSLSYAKPGEDPAGWAPHSIYVQALSELGVAGTIPVLLLFLGCFRLNAQTRKHLGKQGAEKRRSFDYFLALGLDMALVGYLVSGAFLTVLYYPHLWVILGMSVGLHTAITAKPVGEYGLATEPAGRSLALAGSYQEGH